MTGHFITVEDVNSAIYNNVGYSWHFFDTANITDLWDYSEVQYDFCKITRQTVNGKKKYKYTIDIYNANWTGGVIDYIEGGVSISYYDDKLIIEANSPSIQFELYMGPEKLSDRVKTRAKLVNDSISLNLEELSEAQTIRYVLSDGTTSSVSQTVNKGFNLIEYGVADYNAGYLWVKLLKTDFQFNCTQTLTLGKVNKVALGTSAKYKPNGALIGNNTPTIKVIYKDETITATWDNSLNDYCFNLDITEKNTVGKVKFKVIIDANDVINDTENEVILNVDYLQVSNLNNFVRECSNNGTSIIKLNANLTLTSNIPITHNIKIIGNGKTLNLNDYSLILKEGITVTIEGMKFTNGNTSIIQNKYTELTITDCSFTNSQSTKYNGLGSCIYCDVDIESLNNPSDFITNITNCDFINNHSAIFHSGELLVENCRLHNTDLNYIEKHNVAFLYQTDGSAVIRNSIFDIDYTSDELCSNEENIGLAQALIQCGATAKINGASHDALIGDDRLPFSDAVYRNASHLFAKYYYPQISACVYSSPVLTKEDRAVCYCVTGENWIFKQNVQITRASWDSQNEIRKIEWES